MWRWQAGALSGVAAAAGIAASPAGITAFMDQGGPAVGGGEAPPALDPLAAAPPPAEPDGPLRVRARLSQAARLPGASAERLLVVEVEAAAQPAGGPRPAVHLGLVVDGSGSMKEQGRLTAAKSAADALTEALAPGDTLSLVRFSDRADALLPHRPLLDRAAARARIAGLRAAGGTNLYAGLAEGAAQLAAAAGPGVRQLVLLSDGYANIGVTDGPSLRALAGDAARRGLSLSAVGVGWEFNEDLLAGLADAGGGRYRYAERIDHLPILVREALDLASTQVARGATVELSLPRGAVSGVYGWEVEHTGDGLRVPIGDLSAGDVRKIVLRVNLDAAAPGEELVAAARVRGTTPLGAPIAAEARAFGLVTPDIAVVDASVDGEVRDRALEASSAALLRDGAEAFAIGDLATNQARLAEAEAVLRSVGARRADARLIQAADEVSRQRAAYATAPPAAAVRADLLKQTKEDARDWSR